MDQPPQNKKEAKNEETLLDIEQSIEDAKQSREDAIWVLSNKETTINPTDDELMEIADLKEAIVFFEREIKNLENRKAQILNAQNENPAPETQKEPQEDEVEKWRRITTETEIQKSRDINELNIAEKELEQLRNTETWLLEKKQLDENEKSKLEKTKERIKKLEESFLETRGRITQADAKIKKTEEEFKNWSKKDNASKHEAAPVQPTTPDVSNVPPAQPVTPEPTTPKPDSQQQETLELKGEVKMFVEELKLESLLPKEFNKLNENQQTKIIQDLKRRIVDIVKSDAQTQYSEELKAKSWWKKIRQFTPLTKERDLKNIENEIFTKFITEEKANELIKQDLEILTARTKGRDVMVENGKAYFNYFTGSSVIMAGEPNVHNFNEKAHSFVNMPYEWGQEKNGKNKKAYEKAKAEYEEARKQILEQENITPEEKAKLTQEMLETDNLVKMEQLLNTHPEFEKALKEFGETAKGIELAKNAKKFLKSAYSERGGLALLGAGARTLAKGAAITTGMTAITAISAPLIGGMVGYYRGKTRAKETLTERQIKARRGEKDESKEATNTEDIEKLNKRIEDVLGALERAGTDEEKAKKLDQIKRRIEYTQNKIEAGLVNFGDSKNALNNQFNLINNLNKALTISASLDQTTRKDIDARLKQFLSYKTKNITEAQKAFIAKQAKESAAYGAGFALAGYGVRWAIEHFGWWGHAGEVKTDTPKITEETKLNTNHITKTPLISSHASVLQNTPKAVASHEQFRPITPVSSHKTILETYKPTSEPKTEAVESFTPPPEEAIVKNGKGIENAFINQLRTNADLREKLNATLGSSKGPDINDPKFPGWMAHRVALHFGYADANNQVLINRPGAIAFELKIDENGNPIVIEKTVDGTVLKEYGYEKGGYQFGKNPQNEYEYERINKVSVPHQDTGVIEPNDTETHTMGLKEKTLPIEAETLNVGTTEGAFSTEKHSLGIGAEKSFFADKIEKIKNIKEQIEANIDAENTKTAPEEIPRHLKLGEEGFLKFAKGNPYQLNEEGLHKSYSFFKRTINHYLNNGGKIEDWENIKNTNARNFIINESLEKQHKPIYEYLDMLKKVSGEPTLGWSFFHKADTVESYITRALQKLVSDGNLERFEEELRK